MQAKHFSYLIVFAMLLWGGGWPALKVLTVSLNYEVISFWRFFLMIFAFLPILVYLKKPIVLTVTSLKYIIPSAILNVLFMIFAFLGLKYGTAGGGGVIITTLTPVFTFLAVSIYFKKMMPRIQIVGLIIGFVGGLIMINITSLYSLFNGAEIYFLLSALVWAILTLIAQKSHAVIHPIHYSFFIAITATIILFFVALPYDIMAVADEGVAFWGSLLYLAIFGQTIATTIFFIASGKLGSAHASSYMFLVPIFALVLSWLTLGEAIEIHIVIGGAVTLFGVYLINRAQRSES